MKKITYNSTSSGFTLLEMLFALIIFSFALVSLMTIAGRGVITTTNAKEQLTVQYLAEELIEVARNERDTRFLALDLGVISNLADRCNDGCDIEYENWQEMPELKSCSDSLCKQLYVDIDSGIFSTDSATGELSQYSRKLTIIPVTEGNNDQVKLEATVDWNQRGVNRSYTLTTHLVNWMQSYPVQ